MSNQQLANTLASYYHCCIMPFIPDIPTDTEETVQWAQDMVALMQFLPRPKNLGRLF